METIKHQQQMILLQLQTNHQPMEVPDVSGIPLTSLDELIKLEENIASQVEYKRKLVGERSCICWIVDICWDFWPMVLFNKKIKDMWYYRSSAYNNYHKLIGAILFIFQVTYFGLAGGLTIKETVWRIMAKLMTNELAKQINWRGANGKYGFEPLAIKDVVLSKFYFSIIR